MIKTIKFALIPIIILGLTKLIALCSKIFLAWVLTPSEFGDLNVYIASILVAATFSVFGMQKAVVKDIVKYINNKQRGFVLGLAAIPLVITIVLATITSTILYILGPDSITIDSLRVGTPDIRFWLIMCVPPQALIIFLSYYLLSHSKSNLFLAGNQLLFNAIFLLMIAAVYLLCGFDFKKSIMVFSAASWVTSLILLICVIKLLKEFGCFSPLRLRIPPISFYRYSSVLLISTLGYIALSSVDKIMLDFYVDAKQIALYSAAFTVAVTMPMFLVVVDALLSPKLASAFATNDHDRAKTLYQKSNSIVLFSASIVAVLFVVFSKHLVGVFGEYYAQASLMMILLLSGEYIKATLGTTGRLLQLAGIQNLETSLVVLAVLLNIGLNFALIPTYGAMGAISATAITRVVHTLAKAVVVYLKLGFATWSKQSIIWNTLILLSVVVVFIVELQ